MSKQYDISKTPVMPTKCKTCPFADGGCQDVAASVTKRILSDASQMCHC